MKAVLVRRFIVISLLLLLVSLEAGVSGQTSGKKTHSTKTKKGAAAKKKTSPQTARKLGHIKRAFVASADLRPMAQQLLENRTPQAYEGVEAYARKHAKDDAGPLAWLVIGYAHYLDHDYAKARDSWVHSKPLEPLLGDYLTYLEGAAQSGEKNYTAALETLEGFDQKYPDSLHSHDAAMFYAGALMATHQPQRAAAYLEKHREPVKADTELALGRAYLAADDKSKAAEVLRKIYFEMPASGEADAAAFELRNLGEATPAGTFNQRY